MTEPPRSLNDALELVASIVPRHLKALNDDITAAFPVRPDTAFTLALSFAVGLRLLQSFSDPAAKAEAVANLNEMLTPLGYGIGPLESVH